MTSKTLEFKHHGGDLFRRFATMCVLSICFGVAVEYTYLRITPASWWFKYYDVAPVVPVQAGQFANFRSDREIKRRIRVLDFNDSLYCKINGEMSNYVTESDVATNLEPVGRSFKKWTFARIMPERGTYCQLVSSITAHLKYGITKYQTHYGQGFVTQ